MIPPCVVCGGRGGNVYHASLAEFTKFEKEWLCMWCWKWAMLHSVGQHQQGDYYAVANRAEP